MWHRFRFILLVLILILTSCAPPETRAGAWEASTEYGDFTVHVNKDGNFVTQVDYDFTCGGFTVSTKNQPFREPTNTIKGRKLEMWVSQGFIKMISIDGTFSMDGKKLSGTVTFVPQEISGGCTADFESSR